MESNYHQPIKKEILPRVFLQTLGKFLINEFEKF